MVIRRQRTRAWSALALAVFALGLFSDSGAVAAPRAGARHWRIVTEISGVLTWVAAPTTARVYAVGIRGQSGQPGSPISLRLAGRRWVRMPVPRGITGGYGCAGATSARNVWAFAGMGLDQTAGTAAALRLRNGRWVVSGRFGTGQFKGTGFVSSCLVLGPRNVWVFGPGGAGPGAGTWHYNGRWANTPTPAYELGSASAVPGMTEPWSVGFAVGTPLSILVRWSGSRWAQVKSVYRALPKLGGGVSAGFGVQVVARDDVIVPVVLDSHGRIKHLVLRWNASRWSRIRGAEAAFDFQLPGAIPDGRGGWWEISYRPSAYRGALLHGAGGRWTLVRLPVPPGDRLFIWSLMHVAGTTTMYAAGYLMSKSGRITGLLLRY